MQPGLAQKEEYPDLDCCQLLSLICMSKDFSKREKQDVLVAIGLIETEMYNYKHWYNMDVAKVNWK